MSTLKWLNDMVCGIFNTIDASIQGKILFTNHGRRNGHDIPMVEVKLDSVETATAIRRAYVNKKKASFEFGKLHLAYSVTLGTWIRTDILRGIDNQFAEEGRVEMYVAAYSSRPVIHIKESEPKIRKGLML